MDPLHQNMTPTMPLISFSKQSNVETGLMSNRDRVNIVPFSIARGNLFS